MKMWSRTSEFSGARVLDATAPASGSTAMALPSGTYFHDNETGILGANAARARGILRIRPQTANPEGQSHNIYISHIDKFTFASTIA
jgi:hypothetical protein